MDLFWSTIGFIWFVYALETYLDLRQRKKLQETKVPPQIEAIISEEKFHKSQAYGLDKSTFGLLTGLFSQVENTVILLVGAMPWMWKFSENVAVTYFGLTKEHEIVISLIFTGIVAFLETIIHLPFSLYSTFVIEEKHGFNKQTLGLFFIDLIKSLAIGIAIGTPLISLLITIIKWGGPLFYLYTWIFLFAVTLVMITIIPYIQALFNKFEPLPAGDLKTNIEKLASKINFPLTELWVVDGSKRSGHSNAYFYGFFKRKRIVLYDTLLKQLNESEVLAVLCHELGHWQFSHTLKLMLIGQIHLFISLYLFGLAVNWDELYVSFGYLDSKPTIVGLMLFFQFVMGPVDHVISFLLNGLSRRFEYQADSYARKMNYSEALKSGLIKISTENLGNLNPDPLYSTYHYSHPPLVERLNAIAKSE